MSKNAMFDIVKEDLAKLESEMLSVMESPVDLITDIGTHLIEAGGKRLRPALYFLAVRCAKKKETNAMALAVALEMIHMATLVHDDVIDSADMRRGVMTANAKWGNQLSVLSGDYLFAKAFSLVAKGHYDPCVVEILSEIICDLSEGEIVQNRETFQAVREEDAYYRRIAKKTANFIAASCRLGAIVAGLKEAEADALRAYGYAIGMAFQITDDILDVTASSETIGKPAGNDMLEGIVTLPVIRALGVSPRAEELERIVTTRCMDQDTLTRGLELVRQTDAVEYAYRKVDAYLGQALDALPKSIPANVRENYAAVAEFVAMRKF